MQQSYAMTHCCCLLTTVYAEYSSKIFSSIVRKFRVGITPRFDVIDGPTSKESPDRSKIEGNMNAGHAVMHCPLWLVTATQLNSIQLQLVTSRQIKNLKRMVNSYLALIISSLLITSNCFSLLNRSSRYLRHSSIPKSFLIRQMSDGEQNLAKDIDGKEAIPLTS